MLPVSLFLFPLVVGYPSASASGGPPDGLESSSTGGESETFRLAMNAYCLIAVAMILAVVLKPAAWRAPAVAQSNSELPVLIAYTLER